MLFWVQDTGGQIRSSSSLTVNSNNASPHILEVVLNQGEKTTRTKNIRLNISAVDDQQIHSYYVSQSSAVPTNSSSWTTLESKDRRQDWIGYFILDQNSPRGSQDVYVWARDANNGRVSEKATATIDYVPEPGFEHQMSFLQVRGSGHHMPRLAH